METPAKISLEIEYAYSGWHSLSGLDSKLKRISRTIAANLPKSFQCLGSATLLLTDDTRIQGLNQEFRKKNKPTNVLSFPQYDPADLKAFIREQKAQGTTKKNRPQILYLGDIAMSWQTVKAEAARDGKTLFDHTAHLVIHGMLHLFGYDHLNESDAKKMESLEISIMKELGLKNPYLAPPCKQQPTSSEKSRKQPL